MEKIVIVLSFCTFYVLANTNTKIMENLDATCLSCHAQQQIPNRLIYKRYLMQYSTDNRMEEAIFSYLKNPNKETSIMPPQFFLKFPMKEALVLDKKVLEENIQMFFETFDVKKKLILKK